MKTLQDLINALNDLSAAVVTLGNNVQPPVDLSGVTATVTALTAQVQAIILKIASNGGAATPAGALPPLVNAAVPAKPA